LGRSPTLRPALGELIPSPFPSPRHDDPRITPSVSQGKVANLESASSDSGIDAVVGIAHTRWATHGPPNDVNAHPHSDVSRSVAVVHNGIIENFQTLRSALQKEGYVFVSETDTEVFAHLVYDVRKKNPNLDLESVVRLALTSVEGAYGVCFIFSDRPDLLIGARHGSPLLLGVGDGEYFLSSDASAVIEHTKTVEYLKEREIVVISSAGYTISSIDATTPGIRSPELVRIELSLDEIEKGGYKHFMLKEIMEQPRALRDAMRGRINAETGDLSLGGIMGEPLQRLCSARRIIIAACGTSFHSGLVGEYAIETLARVPVEVEYASEFRYRRPILFKDDVLIVISQSGETADTLAAVRQAKSEGVLTLGLVNVVGSTIARETDAGCYLHVGPEIGVASTKAFTGQVALLMMIALVVAKARGELSPEDAAAKAKALWAVPDLIAKVLPSLSSATLDLARSYRYASSFLYLGRGFNFPVALEGALKLKEISYIHAEGYAAAEMKHGPIALIDKFMPVVLIAPKGDAVYDKIKSNLEEILARGGNVIVVTDEGNEDFSDGRTEAVLKIPHTDEWLSPLLTVVPLQLLSYYIADLRKADVDQPRNLAKSVTVE
jgi:glucosamine--fructose-6-phosphate aminotransferase (isomerizing)